jgi:hypothetical protein
MKRRAPLLRLAIALFGLFILVGNWPASGDQKPQNGDAQWQKLRREAINRQRRIIFNNDGNEPVAFCKSVSKEELLKFRTTPLVGSQVDTISYCTFSSGFGMFIHRTKVGQVFNTCEGMFSNNLAQAYLDQGIDPLQTMVEFGHKQGMEVFWSMRMNDTHDGTRTPYGPVMFRANKLKMAHPEYLIGSKNIPPRQGIWSAVNYGLQEIRTLAFQYCEEVCQNYEVDGLELDFFRHAFFFQCSGQNKACGEKELEQMTSLMRRIRAMTEQTGQKRKRPILLAIRVPDSVEYCKFIGLDLERWLAEGLVDLLIVTGYTQLNPWDYSVQLGHKYGVKVYPSLDEPRIRDASAQKLRATVETYRGRAMNAWESGVDGIYMFNYFDPRSPVFREVGDPKVLQPLNKNYFVSVRGATPLPVPYQPFLNVAVLNPASPVAITANRPALINCPVGEAPAQNQKAFLRAQFEEPADIAQARFKLNGQELTERKLSNGWLEFELPPNLLRKGNNPVEILPGPARRTKMMLADLYIAITAR